LDTQPINLKNLDKSNWLTYRFDQIAKNISEDELIEKDISVIEQLNIALNVRSSDSI